MVSTRVIVESKIRQIPSKITWAATKRMQPTLFVITKQLPYLCEGIFLEDYKYPKTSWRDNIPIMRPNSDTATAGWSLSMVIAA